MKKSSGTLYWTGSGSDALAESDLAGTITDEYVFFNSKRIARRKSDGSVFYYFADHLGSSRVVTSATGTVIDSCDYYPFGGEVSSCATSGNRYKFTGKERDGESGVDYFGVRNYGSFFGRFTRPDEPFLDQETKNPQSWNLYSYVRNTPLNSVDPNGAAHMELREGSDGKYGNYLVGDRNGELREDNGTTVQWNQQQQQWESPGEHEYSQEERIQFVANGVTELTRFHSLWNVGVNSLPYAIGGYAAARGAMENYAITRLGIDDTVVIGKMEDLGELGAGERALDLPNRGSPKANWAQNSSRLRQAMNEGKPIRDASAGPLENGAPANNTGFLRAERELLQNHGWTYHDGYWYPPAQ